MASDPKLRPVKWDFDILRKEFIPRPDPRPVPPTGIFDEPMYCMQFNALWMPHILGALEILLQKDSWSGGDGELFRAHQAIYGMLANVTVCGEPMRTVELQSIDVNGCNQLQWKYTDEPAQAWRNLGDVICDGANGQDGAQGLPGENGAPGEDGQDGQNAPIPEFRIVDIGNGCKEIQQRFIGSPWTTLGTVCDGAPGQNCDCPGAGEETTLSSGAFICGGAYGVVSRVLNLVNYNLDRLEEYGGASAAYVGAMAEFVSDILVTIPGIGTILAIAEGILGATITTVRNAVNYPEFSDEMVCLLYCAVKNNGGTFNETAYNAWLAEMKSRYGALSGEYPFINTVENFLRYETTSRYFAIDSLNDDNRCAALCACIDDITVGWLTASSTANESNTVNHVVQLKLTTNAPLLSDVVVTVIGIDGTATAAGNDYLITTPTVTFPAGSIDGATQDVEVSIPEDLDTGAETFTLRIDTVTGGTLDTAHKDHAVSIASSEWCQVFVFDTPGSTEQGWSTGVGGVNQGEFVSGTGWRTTVGGSPNGMRCWIKIPILGDTIITQAWVRYRAMPGSALGAMRLNDVDTLLDQRNIVTTGADYSTNQQYFTLDVGGESAQGEISIRLSPPSTTTQISYIYSIGLIGKRVGGVHPFGADNC